jgi:hypothetical protein
MSNVAINIAAEFTGKKAFNQADTAVNKLNKTVKNLAGSFGLALSTAAVVNFGKAAVKAFEEDQKSAVRLTTAVKNLGLAFAQPYIDNYITKLESSSAIVDEKLRPAFQALLTTTGSVTESQKLLNLAIDASRGSGIDLATVAQDLSNAYNGNTRGLKKYNLGIKKAELATISFAAVQQKFTQQFSGASAAYLTTFAGKLEILSSAADIAKERIGKSLVDALSMAAGKSGDIQNVADAMQNLSIFTSDSIYGIGVLIGKINDLNTSGGGLLGKLLDTALKLGGGILTPLASLGATSKPRPTANRTFMGGQQANLYDSQLAAQKRYQDQQKKLLAAQTKAAKALTAEQKKQAALKKDAGIFDLQQIELIAALQGKLSEEDRKRVELQLALLNGNVAAADTLTKQILMAQDATGNLYKYFMQTPDAKNPFGYLDKWIADFQTKLDALKFPTAPGVVVTPPTVIVPPTNPGNGGFTPGTGTYAPPATNVPPFSSGGFTPYSSASVIPDMAASSSNYGGYAAGQYGQNGAVVVQIDGKTIATANQSQSLSGIPSNVSRVNGMFTG